MPEIMWLIVELDCEKMGNKQRKQKALRVETGKQDKMKIRKQEHALILAKSPSFAQVSVKINCTETNYVSFL